MNVTFLHPAVLRRVAVLGLITVLLALLATSDTVHGALVAVLESVQEVIARYPVAGALLFVVYAALSAMLAFVSVALLLPVAVYAWGEPLSMLLLWAGWTLGGACAWVVGRHVGRPAARWLDAESWLNRIESLVKPSTPWGVVLLFQLALPSEIPGYLLGMVRYSLPRYLLALATAELIYTVAMVHLGASFVAGRAGMVLAIGAAAVLFSVAAVLLLRRHMGARDRAGHAEEERDGRPQRSS